MKSLSFFIALIFMFTFFSCETPVLIVGGDDVSRIIELEQEADSLESVIVGLEVENLDHLIEIADLQYHIDSVGNIPTQHALDSFIAIVNRTRYKLYTCETDLDMYSKASIHNYYFSKDSTVNQRNYSISNLVSGYQDLAFCYERADKYTVDTFTRKTCYPIELAIARDETRRDVFQLIMDNGILPWVQRPGED